MEYQATSDHASEGDGESAGNGSRSSQFTKIADVRSSLDTLPSATNSGVASTPVQHPRWQQRVSKREQVLNTSIAQRESSVRRSTPSAAKLPHDLESHLQRHFIQKTTSHIPTETSPSHPTQHGNSRAASTTTSFTTLQSVQVTNSPTSPGLLPHALTPDTSGTFSSGSASWLTCSETENADDSFMSTEMGHHSPMGRAAAHSEETDTPRLKKVPIFDVMLSAWDRKRKQKLPKSKSSNLEAVRGELINAVCPLTLIIAMWQRHQKRPSRLQLTPVPFPNVSNHPARKTLEFQPRSARAKQTENLRDLCDLFNSPPAFQHDEHPRFQPKSYFEMG